MIFSLISDIVTVGEQNSGNGVVRMTDKAGLQKETLCYDTLTPRTADVVCREAGFVGALSKTTAERTGNDTLTNIVYSCEGSEISLTACQKTKYNVSKCEGNIQAAVLCQKKGRRGWTFDKNLTITNLPIGPV